MDSYGPLHPSRIAKGVSVSATRQKSCNACVRGKRRCDKKAPKCTRCSAKDLDCVYARLPPGATADSVMLEDDLSPHDDDRGQGHCAGGTSLVDIPDFCDMGFVDMPSLAGSSETNTTTSPESQGFSGETSDASGLGLRAADFDTMQMEPDMAGFSIADMLAHGNSTMDALWDINAYAPELPGKLDVAPPIQVAPVSNGPPIRDLALMPTECNTAIDPLEVHDPRTRPGFIMKYFSGLHVTFAQTRALPFLHCRLYANQLPKTVLAAFCAASAYANRTPETKGWAVKLLTDNMKEIYAEGNKATTPFEKLARLQSLLILNVIRVLDGDYGMRASAEKEFHIMRAWTVSMIRERDDMEKDRPKSQWTDRRFPPKTWEGWLLLENMRRTILTSVSLMCLVSVLKAEAPDDGLWDEAVHFTASRYLWDAQSPMEFYRAWNAKPMYLIEKFGFQQFWQYASPDDADEFTRIMLTISTGPDAMDYFLHGDGSSNPVSVPAS